ncbi:hypothetical protein [Acinetobacter larvae]|uniref:hypothetical protein n=1 Tax=Acinetobacter larvae TaxID=1789224 RepID=UPI0012FD07F9|nr:hypothetical protein [Acinetobacter larvae]
MEGLYMKKICSGLLLFFIALQSAVAGSTEALTCQKNIKKFEKYFEQSLAAAKSGDFDQWFNYEKKYSYDYIFRKAHPHKIFYEKRWIARPEFKQKIIANLNMFQDLRELNYVVHVAKPTANFILNQKEICIINTVFIGYWGDVDYGRESVRSADVYIFSRPLGTHKWRGFYYDESIRQVDFDEFFPNFPTDKMALLSLKDED